jgi:general secretion pathway protein C
MMNDRQSFRFFWAIKIALVAVLALVAVQAVVVPFRLGETFTPSQACGEQAATDVDASVSAPQTSLDYSVIADSGLFGDAGQASASTFGPPDSLTAPSLSAEAELGLRLVGAIAGDPATSLAILQDIKTKTTNPYRVGDAIGSASVESIERDRVVLRYHGRPKVLSLTSETMDGAEEIKKKEAKGTTDLGHPALTSGGLPASSRFDWCARLDQVETLFHRAAFEPFVEKGRTEGLRIAGLENIPGGAAFGLKNGDVIRSVNGQLLTSKQKAFQVLQKAKTQPKLNMQLLRDGKVTDLSLNTR